MLSILNKPIYDMFTELVGISKNNIKLCAPFVKQDIISDIYSHKNEKCSLSVVTNINLMSFLKKSSDVNALNMILKNNDTVYNFQRLHAKFYIFDDTHSIITSANLTSSGLKRNYEYGVFIDDITLVSEICKDYMHMCQSEACGKLKIEHTDQIQSIIDSIPSSQEVSIPKLHLEYEDFEEDIFNAKVENIVGRLKGWKKVLFIALDSLEKPIFTTNDFKIFIPFLKHQYPNNNNIDAKIRQQLQELRDLGLIKFEGNGVYKKLWI